MTFTKQQWTRLAMASWIVTLCVCMTSCSLASLPTWLTDIQNILPVATSILSTVLTLVGLLTNTIPASALAEITAIVAKVNAGLTELQALVKSYETSPGTTILTDIEAAANAVIANLQSLFTVAGITDAATQAKIAAIAQLVINEIESVISLIPAIGAAAGTKLAIIIPMTKAEFKKAFDVVLETPTGDPVVDAACASVKPL